MAEQADVDIVKSPKVIGNVTATLTGVPLEEALDNILTSHGFGYVTGKNIIRIAPAEEITEKAESLDNKIYHITYADVAQVEKALEKFISKRGSLSASLATSHIIVTDTESNIKAIDTFIDEIDRITPQVLVEVRIYDITSTEGFDIGADWKAGRNTDVTTIERQNTHERTGTETSGTHTVEMTVTDTVDTVDPTKTGTVTETVTTDKLGPITSYGITDTDTVTKTSTSRRSKPFIGGSFDKETGGTVRFGLLNDAVDIELALEILHTQVSAKLLANPRILVLDNEKAFFNIVTEHPYIERTITGTTITETVKFKEVGVKLEVRPHVTRDGMVRLHIVPEFGIFVRRVIVATSDVPVIDTRKVNTIALVKSNQTVVLSGLRKREISQDIRKIPILGDLPLLGGLFRYETELVKTNELLIFITPRIIDYPVLSQAEQQAYEVTEFSRPKTILTRAEKKESEE